MSLEQIFERTECWCSTNVNMCNTMIGYISSLQLSPCFFFQQSYNNSNATPEIIWYMRMLNRHEIKRHVDHLIALGAAIVTSFIFFIFCVIHTTLNIINIYGNCAPVVISFLCKTLWRAFHITNQHHMCLVYWVNVSTSRDCTLTQLYI